MKSARLAMGSGKTNEEFRRKHRLVGMEEVDEIPVFDAGRVVERGTHEQLRVAGGLYSRMLKTQRELLVEPRAS